MSDDLLQAVQEYVEANIGAFHEKRLHTVQRRPVNEILKRKNPYLFKAKHQDATQLIRSILDAFISSQEETLFGEFLEGVAVFVAERVNNGYKHSVDEVTGIDLVFEKNNIVYVVDIKSGPNWGNSSQVNKMYRNFSEAIDSLGSRYPHHTIVPVNGCMYGKDRKPRKIGKIRESGEVVGEITYWKICGQDFWYFISNEQQLYLEIIEPLGTGADQRNRAFRDEYDKFINKATTIFLADFLHQDYSVDWDRLTQFVSASENEDIFLDLALR